MRPMPLGDGKKFEHIITAHSPSCEIIYIPVTACSTDYGYRALVDPYEYSTYLNGDWEKHDGYFSEPLLTNKKAGEKLQINVSDTAIGKNSSLLPEIENGYIGLDKTNYKILKKYLKD